jgi:hypothetical protein
MKPRDKLGPALEAAPSLIVEHEPHKFNSSLCPYQEAICVLMSAGLDDKERGIFLKNEPSFICATCKHWWRVVWPFRCEEGVTHSCHPNVVVQRKWEPLLLYLMTGAEDDQ